MQGSSQVATNQNIIDVDAGYDPASGISLDEYRQQAFSAIEQKPFGSADNEPKADAV
jgi:hypothetical protein